MVVIGHRRVSGIFVAMDTQTQFQMIRNCRGRAPPRKYMHKQTKDPVTHVDFSTNYTLRRNVPEVYAKISSTEMYVRNAVKQVGGSMVDGLAAGL